MIRPRHSHKHRTVSVFLHAPGLGICTQQGNNHNLTEAREQHGYNHASTDRMMRTWRGRWPVGVSRDGRHGGLAGQDGRGHGGARVWGLRPPRAGDGSGGGGEAAVGLHAAGVGRVLEQAAFGRQVGEFGAPGKVDSASTQLFVKPDIMKQADY